MSSTEILSKRELKNIKGGGPSGLPEGLLNFPDQAEGCPPPMENN